MNVSCQMVYDGKDSLLILTSSANTIRIGIKEMYYDVKLTLKDYSGYNCEIWEVRSADDKVFIKVLLNNQSFVDVQVRSFNKD